MKNILANCIVGIGLLILFPQMASSAQWSSVSTPFDWNSTNAFAVSGTNLFAGTQNYGVYLSTDNGANWTQKNSGLTNTTVLSFVMSGSNLFAGTQNGVFLSTNNGTGWSAVSSGNCYWYRNG
ncbi:MAG: hypothetical protein PHC61_05230 [Chitinivibrionales bacterium]|nr:hypothetical protein [Chitinivibrionales bacterium]